MDVYTQRGTKLVLKEPAMKSGGEGAVYEIEGFSNRVAKIYHDPADAKTREEKINAMVSIGRGYAFKSAGVADKIAWPMSPLFDDKHQFVGFGMMRIDANTELDDLYSYPPTKKSASISMRGRVDILINLCDIINRLHMTGQVFGDFNPNNIKVMPNGTVYFVDADSYHIITTSKEFRCVVCAPGYVAPEVIRACRGTTYEKCKQTTFTVYSDYYALAIHIFRVLMNGCHPFSCERSSTQMKSAPAPKSLDKRVEACETPFFKNLTGYVRPHYAPDIDSFPTYITDLFKRAFVDGHTDPRKRPNALEWKAALTVYQKGLVHCKSLGTEHYHWNGSKVCPYCAADKRYRAKMGNSPVSKVGQFAKGVISVQHAANNSSAQTSVAAAAKTGITGTVPYNKRFWVTSYIFALIALAFITGYVLPGALFDALESEMQQFIGAVGSCVSGLSGTHLYNSAGSFSTNGKYSVSEYLASVFSAVVGLALFCVGYYIVLLIGKPIVYVAALWLFISALISIYW